jgi:diguanylate cyclase (GGDEF)-like protein
VTPVAWLLLGLVLGAALGWVAARRVERARPPQVARAGPDSSDRATGTVIRAADAAADLPPGSKLDVLARLLASRASERVGLASMVLLREVDGGPITVAAVSSGYDARLVGREVEPDSWAGRAVTDGVPVVAPDNEPVLRTLGRDRRRRPHGGVAVPIRSSARVEGAVLVLGEPTLAPSEVVARLEALVIRFAPVLGPAHAVAIAERRANTDELTGLANRRALASAMAAGDAAHSALVMLDLDFFKTVNDTLGHPAGDAALRHVATLLKTTLRAGALAARLGGEEFAVWLPGADLGVATEIAERLRLLVHGRPFRFGGSEHPLSVSCGVSACPVPAGPPESLMATADAALYQAKRQGRNRVVASGRRGG